MRGTAPYAAASLIALTIATAPAMAQVSWEDIRNDARTTEDVLGYGFGPKAQRYSPLAEVNRDTVKNLVPAWSFSFGDERQRGQEAQALVHDGVIYVTASYSRMFAIDARTGRKIWQYSARLPEGIRPCCDVINRGAAIYGDKVYMGLLDASVVALDQKTGKVAWHERFGDYKVGYTMWAGARFLETAPSAIFPGNGGRAWTTRTT